MPLVSSEFDSWCSLAHAVDMRKHAMEAAKQKSEKRFCSLALLWGGEDSPAHYKNPAGWGHERRPGGGCGWRCTAGMPSESRLWFCERKTRESVNEVLGFERAQKLTYLGWCFRCRDSRRSQSSTNTVLRPTSGLLVVVGDLEVRVEDGRRQGSLYTKTKSVMIKVRQIGM